MNIISYIKIIKLMKISFSKKMKNNIRMNLKQLVKLKIDQILINIKNYIIKFGTKKEEIDDSRKFKIK